MQPNENPGPANNSTSGQPPASTNGLGNHHAQAVWSRGSIRIGAILLVVIAAVVVVWGITTRANNDTSLKQWTDQQAIPTVAVALPAASDEAGSLELPGRFEAFARAPIYARVGGYLKSWKVDIGAAVKAGQLLGEIETPDLDQQLLQAQADLSSAQANVSLAGTTAKRWQAMLASDSVSKQEVDDRTGDLASKEAMVNAAKANVARLVATKGYTRLVAPFDGVVTARNTDTGALINAGGGTGPALFEVSSIKKLRLYVNVPQNYTANIKRGTKATITVPEQADKRYIATVETSSGSIDVASGTVLMQLLVDNTAGELLPGGYANVSLDMQGSVTALSVPASALIFDRAGMRVAVVDANSKVIVKSVTVARDLGKTVQLSAGIEAQDKVIQSPPDGISSGDQVHIAESSPASDQPVAASQARSSSPAANIPAATQSDKK